MISEKLKVSFFPFSADSEHHQLCHANADGSRSGAGSL